MEKAKWIIGLSLYCIFCYTIPTNAQNRNSSQSENWRKVDFEVQIGAVQGVNILEGKPKAGDAIYFLDGSSDAAIGFNEVLQLNWQFHQNWRTGFYLAISTAIQRNCTDYNAFWKELHDIDLEEENGTYFYRSDVLCESILEEDNLDYFFGGLGVSLARIIPLGKRNQWTFEPTLNLGFNWLSSTEPYLFLKENGSNNTRSIVYKSEKETYGLPRVGLEGKFRWQLKPRWGLSALLHYNYMRGSFEYEVEEVELFGIFETNKRTFQQSIETAGFNFGAYFSF